MSDNPLTGFFERRPNNGPSLDEPAMVDLEAPLGSHRRPLGNPEHAGRSYLLGMRCACGTTSLAYSGAVDSSESLTCPQCANALS